MKPFTQTDKKTERTRKQLLDGQKGLPQHAIEVDVEINIVKSSEGEEALSHPVKPCSKRKSTSPHGVRHKPCANVATVDVPFPSPLGDPAVNTVPSSPSRASIISETAVEELCHLQNFYSNQLRRINYISHEYLGSQPTEPGVLACIREPLRSLRLPCRVTIAQTARSLWTRVSGRRRLVHR